MLITLFLVIRHVLSIIELVILLSILLSIIVPILLSTFVVIARFQQQAMASIPEQSPFLRFLQELG